MRNRLVKVLLCVTGIALECHAMDGGLPQDSTGRDTTAPFVVDSIEIHVLNAFDDAKAHTDSERLAFRILNSLRFQTREGVVRNNLTFSPGDTVDGNILMESERYLRDLPYIADASVKVREENGHRIVRVVTSDQWTTSIPLSLNNPDGEEWEWSVGLLENNFLGRGLALGFFVSHTQLRDSKYLFYQDNHFLLRHQKLSATYSSNSDGWNHSLSIGRGVLSRSRPAWIWSVDGSTRKSDRTVYFEKDMAVPVLAVPDSMTRSLSALESGTPEALAVFREMREDTLQLRFGRAFPGFAGIHWQTRANLDLVRDWHDGTTSRRMFLSDGAPVIVDSSWQALELPRRVEARPGFTLVASRIQYLRLRNYHHVKWTEDADRGWSLSGAISRNVEAWGATDDGWRIATAQYFGWTPVSGHHLTLDGSGWRWLSGERKDEAYQRLHAEYVWQPLENWSFVLSGLGDRMHNGLVTDQLSLGGVQGLYGFPAYSYSGPVRALGEFETRWFPDFELGTMIPVFAAFFDAGGVENSISEFGQEDIQYAAGFGMRVSMSKSVLGVVNHVNLSWPLNGPLYDGWSGVRFSLLAKTSL